MRRLLRNWRWWPLNGDPILSLGGCTRMEMVHPLRVGVQALFLGLALRLNFLTSLLCTFFSSHQVQVGFRSNLLRSQEYHCLTKR